MNTQEFPLSWQKVFHRGLAPLLSKKELQALEEALIQDKQELLQGATTSPPPLQCVLDWPVEAACPIATCGWKGLGLENVGEVEEYFARKCYDVDVAMKCIAAIHLFLNWWDETPRQEAVPALLEEVRKAIAASNKDM